MGVAKHTQTTDRDQPEVELEQKPSFLWRLVKRVPDVTFPGLFGCLRAGSAAEVVWFDGGLKTLRHPVQDTQTMPVLSYELGKALGKTP